MEKYAIEKSFVCSSCGYTHSCDHYDESVKHELLQLGWKIDEKAGYILCPVCNR